MKVLDGSELAGYIKERQAKQVRALRQAEHVFPKLAIVKTSHNPVIETYVRMKQRYGDDILIDVLVVHTDETELEATIQRLNADSSVHGIIIQLPLAHPENTDAFLEQVDASKDVDGLSGSDVFTPATAMAIDWLAAGYNVELRNAQIAIVGSGRLVGSPLAALWTSQGFDVQVYDSSTDDMLGKLTQADVIVSAAGVPGLIVSSAVKHGAVVIDAATSSEHGKIIGDVADELRERDDLTITPEKGGVGPLTVCALFDNVIRAARAGVKSV